jgi:hypothetical protein
MKKNLLIVFANLVMSASLRGQEFTNLNFESANVAFTTGGLAMSNALPGWSSSWGTNLIDYNPSLLAVWPPIALLGSNKFVLVGNFDVYLAYDISISQTGLVPNGAQTLLFAETSPSLLASLGGLNLSFVAISNAINSFGTSYTIYGADISAFAGNTETLTFSPTLGSAGFLDGIQFSSLPIPEPSAISFLCLGSGILFYLRRKSRR